MERNNIVEKKAVRRPRRVLEYWRGLILNLKTNMNFGTARNYRNSLYRFSEFLDRHDIAFSKIDADLVSDYELWLRKRGLKMNKRVVLSAMPEVGLQPSGFRWDSAADSAVSESVHRSVRHAQAGCARDGVLQVASLAAAARARVAGFVARHLFVQLLRAWDGVCRHCFSAARRHLWRLVQLRAPQDGATAHRAHRAADGCHNQPLQKRSRRVCVPDNQCRRTGCLPAIPDSVGLSQP